MLTDIDLMYLKTVSRCTVKSLAQDNSSIISELMELRDRSVSTKTNRTNNTSPQHQYSVKTPEECV